MNSDMIYYCMISKFFIEIIEIKKLNLLEQLETIKLMKNIANDRIDFGYNPLFYVVLNYSSF